MVATVPMASRLSVLHCVCIFLGLLLGSPRPLHAQVAEPSPRNDDAFDFMNLLAQHDLHDLQHERWNAYGQITWISSFKLPFAARYTNLNGSINSLRPTYEHSFTGTATLYLALALWPGGEIQAVPELISERPLSHLAGLGGVIQNFELQKTGSATPTVYLSRVYLRHTFNFGGTSEIKNSDPMQLGATVQSHRLVITVGNFSILDLFDKNTFSGDLRRQFFNMAFLTHAAYDFAADARGYTWGAVVEYLHDAWAVRFGHIVAPQHPNQLELNFRFWQYYGQQVELEHMHTLFEQPGALRVLAYRNQENMGRFDDAMGIFANNPAKNATTCTGFSYGSHNAGAPDLCWARRPNIKMGLGINLEQQFTENFGGFARGMVSDGGTEVYSYTSTDQSLSLGVLAHGAPWGRPNDLCGLAYAQGWISDDHAAYLNAGGIDGFLGDGRLTRAAEQVVELFYSAHLVESLWLSADYQHINNPGYNSARGPVNIFGVRGHAEF